MWDSYEVENIYRKLNQVPQCCSRVSQCCQHFHGRLMGVMESIWALNWSHMGIQVEQVGTDTSKAMKDGNGSFKFM